MILPAARLILLLVVCSLGPGLWIVGRLKWSPMEKLCGAFAASFITVYLVSFGLFCIGGSPWAYWIASAVCALIGLAGWRTALVLLRSRYTRATLIAFGVVLGWDFLHLALVRNYSGGLWSGDWHEQYDRTRFFLHELPVDYPYLGRYSLAARPPMMNAMAAFFCAQVGLSFEAFSLAFLFLNAWAFVPCCALLRRFAPRLRNGPFILAALFMLNPSIVENVTYTWTKAFSAGWVVLGVCLYLRRRTLAAALSLAAGMLVHYSAAPFALAIGLHCLVRSPAKALASGIAAAAFLASWFSWSIVKFGLAATISSPALTSGVSASSPGENIARVFFNLYTSLVPHPLQFTTPHYPVLANLHGASDVRDYYFTMAQTTLPMMIGLTGGLIAAGLLARLVWRRHGWEKRFWIFILLFGCIAGLCTNHTWDVTGCAHILFQPVALMGVTLLAAFLPRLGSMAFGALLAGLSVDYGLGILLQFNRESLVPQPNASTSQLTEWFGREFGYVGLAEYVAKRNGGYVFWGDQVSPFAVGLQIASIIGAVLALWFLLHIHGVAVHKFRRNADLTL